MVDLRTAVSSAHNYLISIQHIMGDLQDIRLEEVELSEDQKYWLITLGFELPVNTQNPFGIMAGITPKGEKLLKREYKLFKVNSETGEVEAMKIRKL